jgi:hypothetical protein
MRKVMAESAKNLMSQIRWKEFDDAKSQAIISNPRAEDRGCGEPKILLKVSCQHPLIRIRLVLTFRMPFIHQELASRAFVLQPDTWCSRQLHSVA